MDPTTDVAALWSDYLAGGSTDIDLRNRLAEAHLPLVHYVAARMLPSQHFSVQMQDLVSYGMLGLLDAVEKYDPDKGAAFSTFAWKRIQGSITDELRSQAWEPRALRRTHRRYQAEAARLEMALGRPPSLDELATAVDATVGDISRVMGEMALTRMSSLSAPVKGQTGAPAGDGSTDLSLGDVVHAQWAESEPVVKEMAVAVSRAVGRLPENEQLLLRLIYVQHMTLREIAEILRVTDSWVSHLHTRSMVLLQRALAAQY